jgi:hypothetical protein
VARGSVGFIMMTYTQFDLARTEKRVRAGERCLSRQREALKRRIDSGLPAEELLNMLAELQVTLFHLQQQHKRIQHGLAAANTQQAMDLFWGSGSVQRADARRA